MIYSTGDITAIIVAGGRSSRVDGRNQGLLTLHGKPLVQHVTEKLHSQVGQVIINTNSELNRYRKLGYPVFSDNDTLFRGPLSGLVNANSLIKTPIIMTLPCDSPFIPNNLSERLIRSFNENSEQIHVVFDGKQQNMFMMFHQKKLDSIDEYLNSGGRSIYGWIEQFSATNVDFTDQSECFLNINTLEELECAHKPR